VAGIGEAGLVTASALLIGLGRQPSPRGQRKHASTLDEATKPRHWPGPAARATQQLDSGTGSTAAHRRTISRGARSRSPGSDHGRPSTEASSPVEYGSSKRHEPQVPSALGQQRTGVISPPIAGGIAHGESKRFYGSRDEERGPRLPALPPFMLA